MQLQEATDFLEERQRRREDKKDDMSLRRGRRAKAIPQLQLVGVVEELLTAVGSHITKGLHHEVSKNERAHPGGTERTGSGRRNRKDGGYRPATASTTEVLCRLL